MCGAGALLVCDTNFVADPLLRMVAHQNGICVLTPYGKGSFSIACGWNAIPILLLLSMSQIGAVVPNVRCTMNEQPVLATGGVCPTCGELYRLTSSERIAPLFDEGSFEEWDASMEESDPLEFPQFNELIEKQRVRSGFDEGVRTGKS